MEIQNLLEKGVGNIEQPVLKPAKVKIVAVEIQKEKKDGSEMKTPLLKLKCKHPDKDELIEFTKVKIEKNSNLKVVGLWVVLDEEDNIQKGSALNKLLDYLKVKILADVYNKEIEAIEESKESSYLCLKAY